jgi:hypothetical protein
MHGSMGKRFFLFQLNKVGTFSIKCTFCTTETNEEKGDCLIVLRCISCADDETQGRKMCVCVSA